MKKIFLLILLCASLSKAQAPYDTYTGSSGASMRMVFGFADNDSLHTHTKWARPTSPPFSGGDSATLIMRSANGFTGEAGWSSRGTGGVGNGNTPRMGTVMWDSAMRADTQTVIWVWGNKYYSATPNRDGQIEGEMYFAMSSTNASSWNGYSWRLIMGFGSTETDGVIWFSKRRIAAGVNTQMGAASSPLNGPGDRYATVALHDTLMIKKTGNKCILYKIDVGTTTVTRIDSMVDNSAFAHTTGYYGIGLNYTNTPTRVKGFGIKYSSDAPPPPPSRDQIGPEIVYVSPLSASTDTTVGLTVSFRIRDNDLTTQKNPGLDSAVLRLGLLSEVANGHVRGDSLKIKLGNTTDTVITYTFTKKTQGTYAYQVTTRDDTGNATAGTIYQWAVNIQQSTSFQKILYFYQQDYAHGWYNAFNAAYSTGGSPEVGKLAATFDVINLFYTTPQAASPYMTLRNATAATAAAESSRFWGIDWAANTGFPTRNYGYQMRDSLQHYGHRIVLSLAAIDSYLGSATVFNAMIKDTNKVKVFASTITDICRVNYLNGVDLNWEFPSAAEKPYMAFLLKTLRDTLNARLGSSAWLSMTVDNPKISGGSMSIDWSACGLYLDKLIVESGSRVVGAGQVWTGNPAAVYHPYIDGLGTTDVNGDGIVVQNFDGYTYSDTTHNPANNPQNTYTSANGMRAALVAAGFSDVTARSKVSQIIPGWVEYYAGTTGPGQPAGGVTYPTTAWGFSGIVLASNGGGGIQAYYDQFYLPSREHRDSSQNHYITFNQSGTNYLMLSEDSLSLSQKISMLKSRQISSVTINSCEFLFNAGGYKGNGNRLQWLDWLDAAVGATTTTQLPPPTLLLPTNGATSQSIQPVFRWRRVLTSQAYRLTISNNATFTSLAFDQDVGSSDVDTSYSFGTSLATNTTYYWKVSAKLGASYGLNSSTFSFTTLFGGTQPTVIPHKPTLFTPVDAATSQASSLTAVWTQAFGDTVTKYHVQFSLNSGFTNIVKYDSILGTPPATSYAVTNLTPSTTYYWRVKASNTVGDSGYTTAFSFTVAATPVVSEKNTFIHYNPITGKMSADYPIYFGMSYVAPNLWTMPTDSGAVNFYSTGCYLWNGTKYDFSQMSTNWANQANTWPFFQAFNGGVGTNSLQVSGNAAISGTLTVGGVTIPQRDSLARGYGFYNFTAADSGTFWVVHKSGLTIKSIKAYRVGGTSASIQVKKNGVSLLSSNYATTTSWASAGTPVSTTTAIGDIFKAYITAASGTVTEVYIQVEYEK